MNADNKKLFDDRVKEVNGEADLKLGLDPLEILGLPILQLDGSVNWTMPKTEDDQ